jgi:hypothetical protein
MARKACFIYGIQCKSYHELCTEMKSLLSALKLNLTLLVILILYFQDVLKSTRTQLERELALDDVSGVRDLPAYNLLKT